MQRPREHISVISGSCDPEPRACVPQDQAVAGGPGLRGSHCPQFKLPPAHRHVILESTPTAHDNLLPRSRSHLSPPSRLLLDALSGPRSPSRPPPQSSDGEPLPRQIVLSHSVLVTSRPGSPLFRGTGPGLRGFHIPHSIDVLLGAEQVIDRSSSVDGLTGRVRQVLLGMMKCS